MHPPFPHDAPAHASFIPEPKLLWKAYTEQHYTLWRRYSGTQRSTQFSLFNFGPVVRICFTQGGDDRDTTYINLNLTRPEAGQTWTPKGPPQIRGARGSIHRTNFTRTAPPEGPQEMWTPRLCIINREQDVHMSTFCRFLVKSCKLSPKMGVDTPRGGVHTPFLPWILYNKALKNTQTHQILEGKAKFVHVVVFIT